MQEKIFLNAINKTEVFLPNELQKLLEVLGGVEEIWKNNNRNAFRQAEISEEKIERFFGVRSAIDPEKEWKRLEREKLSVAVNPNLPHFLHGRVKSGEGLENYPEGLLTLPDPPPILYIKGTLALEAPVVAVVGTRKFSLYGKQVAQDLSRELSQAGVTIVSGLARGIDTFAHSACVEQENPTIAVVGSGIDEESLYPADNRALAQKIVATGGALLSEFSPGAKAWPRHFPQRNRIVAALALGVVVVEAPFKSGAMITARLALEQGKEVFAVPGPIHSLNSEGTNYLIKNGAHPVTCVEDVLEILRIEIANPKSQPNGNDQNSTPQNLTPEEQKIVEALQRENLHIDKIIEKTQLPPQTVISTLTLLEIKNLITHIGNNIYGKNF